MFYNIFLPPTPIFPEFHPCKIPIGDDSRRKDAPACNRLAADLRYLPTREFLLNLTVGQIAFGIAHRLAADLRYLPTREFLLNLTVGQIAFGIAHRLAADLRYLPTREFLLNL